MQAPVITTALAGIRRAEQIDQARAHRRAAAAPAAPPAGHDLTIRMARPDDAATLARLAQLDGRGAEAMAAGDRTVVAVVDGAVVAARDLRGGAISDPFRATAEVLALLDVRARQLTGRAVRVPRPRAPRRAMPVLRAGGAR